MYNQDQTSAFYLISSYEMGFAPLAIGTVGLVTFLVCFGGTGGVLAPLYWLMTPALQYPFRWSAGWSGSSRSFGTFVSNEIPRVWTPVALAALNASSWVCSVGIDVAVVANDSNFWTVWFAAAFSGWSLRKIYYIFMIKGSKEINTGIKGLLWKLHIMKCSAWNTKFFFSCKI